jgi:hypothetical protein
MHAGINPYEETLRELLVVIEKGVLTPEPFFGPRQTGVFRSNYDWHSSVHAHWSLLAISRILEDGARLRLALDRLNAENLSCEQSYLRENPSFELPYGQAWLLILLAELEKHGRYFADLKLETLHRVSGWLQKTPFPDGTEGRCLGAHNAWIISYFLLKKSGLQDPRILAIDQKFLAAGKIRNEDHPRDFASPAALAEVLNQTTEIEPLGLESLRAMGAITIPNCHKPGLVITTYWPYAMGAASGSEIHRDRFNGFLRNLMRAPDFWKTDFKMISHWIPQYIWFGIWLALGEP